MSRHDPMTNPVSPYRTSLFLKARDRYGARAEARFQRMEAQRRMIRREASRVSEPVKRRWFSVVRRWHAGDKLMRAVCSWRRGFTCWDAAELNDRVAFPGYALVAAWLEHPVEVDTDTFMAMRESVIRVRGLGFYRQAVRSKKFSLTFATEEVAP